MTESEKPDLKATSVSDEGKPMISIKLHPCAGKDQEFRLFYKDKIDIPQPTVGEMNKEMKDALTVKHDSVVRSDSIKSSFSFNSRSFRSFAREIENSSPHVNLFRPTKRREEQREEKRDASLPFNPIFQGATLTTSGYVDSSDLSLSTSTMASSLESSGYMETASRPAPTALESSGYMEPAPIPAPTALGSSGYMNAAPTSLGSSGYMEPASHPAPTALGSSGAPTSLGSSGYMEPAPIPDPTAFGPSGYANTTSTPAPTTATTTTSSSPHSESQFAPVSSSSSSQSLSSSFDSLISTAEALFDS